MGRPAALLGSSHLGIKTGQILLLGLAVCTLSNQHTGSLRCACAFNMSYPGTFLVVQWLRLRASTPEDTGSAPGWESSTCPTVWSKSKKKKEVKIFYKDLLYSTGISA